MAPVVEGKAENDLGSEIESQRKAEVGQPLEMVNGRQVPATRSSAPRCVSVHICRHARHATCSSGSQCPDVQRVIPVPSVAQLELRLWGGGFLRLPQASLSAAAASGATSGPLHQVQGWGIHQAGTLVPGEGQRPRAVLKIIMTLAKVWAGASGFWANHRACGHGDTQRETRSSRGEVVSVWLGCLQQQRLQS